MRFIAILDACVLYPAPIRDLFMRLAVTDVFAARWTHKIHDEWIRNVLANRPDLSPKQLQRTRELMDSHVRDCLVSGYEPLIEGLTLPDLDDRHVLAAAIQCGAQIIITFNLKALPQTALEPYGIEAQHPDVFIEHLLSFDITTVCNVVQRHRVALINPPKTINEYLCTLKACGLVASANLLQGYAEIL